MAENAPHLRVREAQFENQGELGKLLLACYAPVYERRREAASAAGISLPPAEDELMAADDFYFSTIELMNCCYFARRGDVILGASAINPFTEELAFVAVYPPHRRQGLGRRLVERALRELEKRGAGHAKVDLLLAEEMEGGVAFLQALGFFEVERTIRLSQKLAGETQG